MSLKKLHKKSLEQHPDSTSEHNTQNNRSENGRACLVALSDLNLVLVDTRGGAVTCTDISTNSGTTCCRSQWLFLGSEHRHNHLHGGHLLTQTILSVPGSQRPILTTGIVSVTGTGSGSTFSTWCEPVRDNLVISGRNQSGGQAETSGEKRTERPLIVVTCSIRLTRQLGHDGVVEEETRRLQNSVDVC